MYLIALDGIERLLLSTFISTGSRFNCTVKEWKIQELKYRYKIPLL